jgi:hypothetical protein
MGGLKVVCGHFMEHRGKNGEIFSADERYFDVELVGDCAIKTPCGFDAGEPATEETILNINIVSSFGRLSDGHPHFILCLYVVQLRLQQRRTFASAFPAGTTLSGYCCQPPPSAL